MADVLIKPAFQSAAEDRGVAGQLGPAEWNAARLISGGNAGDVPVRDLAAATGASWGQRSRVLHVNTTLQGTPASLVETDLWSYVLPAGTLDVNGRALRISAWLTMAANTNQKIVRLYGFGAVLIGTSSSVSGAP